MAFLPIQTTNERKAFADTLTYLRDRHVFKGGVEYNETSVDQVFRGNWRGVFIFANKADLLAGRWREYRQFGGLGGLHLGARPAPRPSSRRRPRSSCRTSGSSAPT